MSSKAEDTDQHFLGSLRKTIQFWMKRRTSGSKLVKAFAQKTPILLQLHHNTFSAFLLNLPYQPGVTAHLFSKLLAAPRNNRLNQILIEVVPSCM